MAYYAWSTILAGKERDKDGYPIKDIKFPYGSQVTPKDLKVDEAEFAALVVSGAVRDYEPPNITETSGMSPVKHARELIRRMQTELEGENVPTYVSEQDDEDAEAA